jgi:Rad3-related DNA helicase
MWSLYKKKDDSEGILSYGVDKLEPLKFSNGKTQADVVKEILDSIAKGNKLIFIKGVCGTGKSCIALNLARHFKKTSIVVPIKSLQEQYEKDYTIDKFILKKDNKKMKISMIKGRNNFNCPFSGERADDPMLPCTIQILEKNIEQLNNYISMNDSVDSKNILGIDDIRRMSVAPACPYWSPLLPSKMSNRVLEKAKKKTYETINSSEYALFKRNKGCGYYDQYDSYIDSDVLIFNSQKYILESLMGRKPKTDLEIIDECDEFLDDFASEKKINLNRLLFALSSVIPKNNEDKEEIKSLMTKTNYLLFDFSLDGIEKLEKTKASDLIHQILKNPYLAEEDEDNYYNRVFEYAKEFEEFLEETYISFEKTFKLGEKENAYLTLVTINLERKFDALVKQNKVIVLMSGTLHSEQVLKDIFGIKDFKVIEAETISPGTITKARTGLEINCKMENFKSGLITRRDYLKAFEACITKAKTPILVHVNSFEDLPTELEKAEYKIINIISRERLLELQKNDKSNNEVDKFKSGEVDILFTTKCSRGVDFPGNQCNSIVLTKYPYPNIKSPFWQILQREHKGKYSEFYFDKARRELLQKVYRGVRFKDDHVLLFSPDIRVLDARIG